MSIDKDDKNFPLPFGERVRVRGGSKEFSRRLRRNQSDAEHVLWRRLRSRQIYGVKFRRQHPIGNYIVDFCSPERKVIIEVDGGQHTFQRARDQYRESFLREEGYHILRFWNHDVLTHLDVVLEQIGEAVKQSPSPQPSPWKGEGES